MTNTEVDGWHFHPAIQPAKIANLAGDFGRRSDDARSSDVALDRCGVHHARSKNYRNRFSIESGGASVAGTQTSGRGRQLEGWLFRRCDSLLLLLFQE